MILLADPAGPVSGLVAQRLRFLGRGVRALTADAREAARLATEGIEAVAPDALEASLRRVTHVFLEAMPQQSDHAALVKAAARRPGIHVVRLSADGASVESPFPYLRRQGALDDALREGETRHTFLRPSLYIQDLLAFAPRVASRGEIVACIGEGRPAFVDARDAADAAVATLSRAGLAGADHVLTGPRSFGLADVADIVARVAGAAVRVVDLPPDHLRDRLVAAGVPAANAEAEAARMGHYRVAPPQEPTDALVRLTGIPARTVEGFLVEHAWNFLAPEKRVGQAWILPDPEGAIERPVSW